MQINNLQKWASDQQKQVAKSKKTGTPKATWDNPKHIDMKEKTHTQTPQKRRKNYNENPINK